MRKSIYGLSLILVAIGAAFYFGWGSGIGRFLGVDRRSPTVAMVEDGIAKAEGARAASPRKKSSQRQDDDVFANGTSFDSVMRLAEQGDPKAQRLLADIYGDCAQYILFGEKYFDHLDVLATMKPQNKPQLDMIKQRMAAFCPTVTLTENEKGRPDPFTAMKNWTRISAEGGDLISEMNDRVLSREFLSDKGFKDYITKAFRSGDPKAVFAISELMTVAEGYPGDPESEDGIDARDLGYAIQIAACRSGMSCGTDSRLMRQICISHGACQYRSYEEFVMSALVPPERRGRVTRMVMMVLAAFERA